jgi:LPXTG-motif cell wall-anchored protein
MRKMMARIGVVAAVVAVSGLGSTVANATGPALPIPGQCTTCGKAAPAPEIGGSVVGLLMAGGLAFYVVRRRRSARS